MNTLTPIDLAKSLIRLSSHKLGVREARCLFLCLGGSTCLAIAKAAKENPRLIKGQINSLRAKRLIVRVETPEGGIYKPTRQGIDVINHILGRVLS